MAGFSYVSRESQFVVNCKNHGANPGSWQFDWAFLVPGVTYAISSAIRILLIDLMLVAAFIHSKLNKEMEAMTHLGKVDPSDIQKWNARHQTVCRLVDHINDCFGSTMLLAVCYVYVNSVIYSTLFFRLIYESQRPLLKGEMNNLITLTLAVLRQLILSLTSHILKAQVDLIIRQLFNEY